MADKIGASSVHGLRYDAQADSWFSDAAGRELAASEVLASAARTTTASSSTISTRGARGIVVRLSITSVPGTGGDLTLRVLWSFASGATVTLGDTLAVLRSAGANAWYLAEYPGVTEITSGRVMVRSKPLPPEVVVQVIHSGSESWTYSAEATLLP